MALPIRLKLTKVSVTLQNNLRDQIYLTLDLPSPDPQDNECYAVISVGHGQGIEWCRKALSIEPEIVDNTHQVPKFSR